MSTHRTFKPAALVRSATAAKAGTTRGFTLVEMMITLAVFLLLAAAAFGLLNGVLRGAMALTDNQNHVDEIVALKAYLDKKVGELPARSTLISYQRGDGEGLVQNGIVYGTVNFATAIDAKVQPNGYYTLRLSSFETEAGSGQAQDARQVLATGASSDDPTLVWTPLISDVKTLDWKFLDFNQTLWVEIWSSGTKPNLMELSLQLAGDQQPTTMDFWVPKMNVVPAANPQVGR